MAEPTYPNEGARFLEARLQHGDTKKLAARLGVVPSVVSKWASAKRKPHPEHRARLEDDPMTRIPWRLWDEPPTDVPVPPLEVGGEPVPTFRDPPASTGTDGVA